MKIWRFGLAICALAAAIEPLHADLKVTRKTSFEARDSYVTDYFRGKLWREDWIEQGALSSEVIVDKDKLQSYLVYPKQRQYAIFRDRYEGVSGTYIVTIEEDTKDTGERRNMFGYEARHLVTTQRGQGREPSVEEGWYIDVPGYSGSHATAFLIVDVPDGRQPVFKVNHTGPQVRGLAVWEKRGNLVTEVTELSDAPLDAKLFEPPSGFRRVIPEPAHRHMSLPDQFAYECERFENWLGLI